MASPSWTPSWAWAPGCSWPRCGAAVRRRWKSGACRARFPDFACNRIGGCGVFSGVQANDSADFDAFYAATVRRVVLYLYAACGDRAEAQDVAQEAFARAWQHWGRVSAYEEPEAWVRTVAWRLMVNRWRGLRRRLAARS